MKTETQRIDETIGIAIRYGGIEGDHHKAWVIDQMLRILAGDGYDELIRLSCEGEDGPDSYDHDVGIPP